MAEFLRAAWGAQPAKSVGPRLSQVPDGVVHHIGGGDPYPLNVVATLQQIQSMEQHGAYVDIAYNWGVDKDGNLWELRGDVTDGATLGYAGKSFSVLAICNAAAPNFTPTPALIAGIAACFRNAQARGVLAKGAYIDGHHYFDSTVTNSPTSCPSALMGNIPEIRQLVAGSVPAPKPPVWKVKPMYNPPLGPIAAVWQDAEGRVLAAVSPFGDVYAWGVPFRPWPNKNKDFAGHQAARIGQAKGLPAGRYTVTATDGAKYTP